MPVARHHVGSSDPTALTAMLPERYRSASGVLPEHADRIDARRAANGNEQRDRRAHEQQHYGEPERDRIERCDAIEQPADEPRHDDHATRARGETGDHPRAALPEDEPRDRATARA